jgi:dimethylhistidine N-methyltransferase
MDRLSTDTAMPGYRIVDRLDKNEAAEREAVIAGLLAESARINPKYFYDELGCALYGAICRLPEYYPTRTEILLFQTFRAEIGEAMGTGKALIDLGAGDCCKAQGWIPFLSPECYVAVDVARAEIERSLMKMATDFPGLVLTGVVTDFSRSLDIDDVLPQGPLSFFYPGSSIGNFSPPDARAFLAQIRALCARHSGSGLLIGVDCKKDKAVLDAAYDDALGVTAAFNRNVLRHLNRIYGFDFDIGAFAHRGFYNESQGRIEMHLEVLRDQTVRLGAATRTFAATERIHTENSYKYHPEEFAQLLRDAGFTSQRTWCSEAPRYAVFYAQ